MTGDPSLAMADLTVVLQPNSVNGCWKVSYLQPRPPGTTTKSISSPSCSPA